MTTTTNQRSVAADSASGAVWTLASRITGFIRVVLIGAVLGPSFVGNLFQLANQLPWLVFEITVGSLLGSLLVPALMQHVKSENANAGQTDLDALSRLAGAFASTVIVGFGLVTLAVMALSPLLARLFAVGVPAELRSDLIADALPLVLLTAPQLIGYGLTVTAQSIQQAMGSFAFPAGAAIVENVAVIATLAAYAVVFESNTTVPGFDLDRILLLGIGSSLGVTAHVLLQWWGVRRLGLRVRLSAGWREPEVRDVLTRALAATASAALNGIRIFGILLLANSVAGGVVALQLGLNLIGVAVALGAKPVAYAMLPRLAVLFRSGDLPGYRTEYDRGVGLAGLMIVPAALGLGLLGWLIGPALAFGAMNTSDGRALLAVTVTAIAGSVAGEALHQLGVAGCYGRNDTRSPFVAFALRLGLTAAFVPFAWLADGAGRIAIIAAVMSAADLLSGIVLHRSATRQGQSSYDLSGSLRSSMGASILGFGVAAGLGVAISTQLDAALVTAAIVGLLGLGITLLARNRFDSELVALVSQLKGSS